MIHHSCGLFAVYGHEDASRLTYFGLYAQQHRGQESCGIVSRAEDGHCYQYKGMGLVPDVFEEKHLQKLKGTVALGHVRYSTTGRPSIINAQPLMIHYKDKYIAIAHNGNLVNAVDLRRELEDDGAVFMATSDTEVIMHVFVRELAKHDVIDAVRATCNKLRGAYCLLFLIDDTLVAVRDPYGFHPLSLGRLDKAPVLASETCAFDLMEAEYEHNIRPGEMYVISPDGEMSLNLTDNMPERPRQCIFELVYFARPDSYIFGEQVY